MPSPWPPVERARPLFGSLARVRVEGCEPGRATAAISEAFAVMADAHRTMSFHDPASELSALNRAGARGPVRLGPQAMEVLAEALWMARASAGAFDPTVAPLAVRAGALPAPEGAPEPDPRADWRDVELDVAEGWARLRRPAWIDLGGIAKGYAVDGAVGRLRALGIGQGCVEAGGDLRVFGPRAEAVALDSGPGARAIGLRNASLASSGRVVADPRATGLHFDGASGRAVAGRFVAVRAARCVQADALTKVVMARGRAARDLLRSLGARAALCSARGIWSAWGAPP